jgi:ADP-ribose pyrophosphatase YjhB (NUDIX family)
MEVKFCVACGQTMADKDMDGIIRKACTSCSYVHWGNYSIGVGALVMKDDKLLLVRRAQEPGKGFWTNPGGYAEQSELIQDTIRREVLEESNIHAEVKGILALRDQPRAIHNLYIAFEMAYVDGEPIPDGQEVDDAGFFSFEEMESMNVAVFTRWLVDVVKKAKTEGLMIDQQATPPLNSYGLFRV